MALMNKTTQTSHYQQHNQPKDLQRRMDNTPAWIRKLSESESSVKQDII